MSQANYLIGRGELLVEPVTAPLRKPEKAHVYSVVEATRRLAPQARIIADSLSQAPRETAPDGVQVAKFTLHPSYIAKSYYPSALLAASGLEAVGSRPRKIQPEKHTRKRKDVDPFYGTSDLFVAGRLAAFENLATILESADVVPEALGQIIEFEEMSVFSAAEKTAGRFNNSDGEMSVEAVLHLPSVALAPSNKSAFLNYAEELGFGFEEELGFQVKNLWFLPGQGPAAMVQKLAAFSTMRVIRPMPSLSVLPVPRTFPGAVASVGLPSGAVVSEEPRVAILDGGLPADHPIRDWVESYREMNSEVAGTAAYEQHGLAVASAFLFGAIHPGSQASTPPSRVAVFRVLDSSTDQDNSFELYQSLGHIEEVLLSGSYDFVNLSLGPTLPVEDDDVHAWTAVIDDLLSDGSTLLTVAVGNNGANDRASGNARIQVPADAVNALAVGASSRTDEHWTRATYSAVGPGRIPGIIKPDVLAFGGSPDEYFHVISDATGQTLAPVMGTSMAAPLALRQAVMIRSTLGNDLTPLALRALLIHTAERSDGEVVDVGWGKLLERFEDVVVTGEGVARVLYQGELKPGKYVRAAVPIPTGGLEGMVNLRATFCFATPVDVQSPDVYTRAGLEVRFRPDLDRIKDGSKTPTSRSFFTSAPFADESRLRTDDGKWETVMHAQADMRGSTLADPAFDIHYNARNEGGASRSSEALKYALVITIEAHHHVDLHAEVLAAYPNLLVPIEPQIDIDLTT